MSIILLFKGNTTSLKSKQPYPNQGMAVIFGGGEPHRLKSTRQSFLAIRTLILREENSNTRLLKTPHWYKPSTKLMMLAQLANVLKFKELIRIPSSITFTITCKCAIPQSVAQRW